MDSKSMFSSVAEGGLDAGPSNAAAENSSDDLSSATGHKRSLSGNILAKLSFLRPASEGGVDDGSDPHKKNKPGVNSLGTETLTNGAEAKSALKKTTRSRKGSLRKTAILGTGKLRMEKRGPGLETIVSPRLETKLQEDQHAAPADMQLSPDSDDYPTPRASYDHASHIYSNTLVSSEQGKNGLRLGTSSDENVALSGIQKRLSRPADMSTTDEEEIHTFPRTLGSGNGALGGLGQIAKDSSHFSIDTELKRRRSAQASKSPLATMSMESVAPQEEWDYSETEWWGWVILVMTWAVFVVGMGSCFGVWSWAWDVGETPYAPPELEDDPTLPIVGYYPALIILTGVMAWVWVIVAWVGMKYFKHAKISGEEI